MLSLYALKQRRTMNHTYLLRMHDKRNHSAVVCTYLQSEKTYLRKMKVIDLLKVQIICSDEVPEKLLIRVDNI